MEAEIKQVKGLTFIAKADSNHWITVDGPKQFFGSEAASRPMELLLIALGTCTASDVVAILQKKRVTLKKFEVKLRAERAEEHPKIHIEYLIGGDNIQERDVERAIELSQEKYCPISAMLRKAAELTYSYQILK